MRCGMDGEMKGVLAHCDSLLELVRLVGDDDEPFALRGRGGHAAVEADSAGGESFGWFVAIYVEDFA